MPRMPLFTLVKWIIIHGRGPAGIAPSLSVITIQQGRRGPSMGKNDWIEFPVIDAAGSDMIPTRLYKVKAGCMTMEAFKMEPWLGGGWGKTRDDGRGPL